MAAELLAYLKSVILRCELLRAPKDHPRMPVLEQITIAPQLTFDALTSGVSGAPLVLLLHGFAESMHCWRRAGRRRSATRAIAPSRRASAAIRRAPGPIPRDTLAITMIDRLMDDAIAIAAACGLRRRAAFIWSVTTGAAASPGALADRYAATAGLAHHAVAAASQRLQPRAADGRRRTGAALEAPQGVSRTRCRRCRAGRRLPNGCATRLAANGVPSERDRASTCRVLGNKAAMEGALAWYRARGAIRGPLGPIRVPTLYIWGDADDTVGRAAAEGTVDFIAAPYRFEVLPGVGHFAADQAPARVCELMLEHLAAHPVVGNRRPATNVVMQHWSMTWPTTTFRAR